MNKNTKKIIESIKKEWKVIAVLILALTALLYTTAAVQSNNNKLNAHWQTELTDKCPCLNEAPQDYQGNFSLQPKDVFQIQTTKNHEKPRE